MIAASTYADKYWHLYRSDCRTTLIYAHTTSRVLPACDISLGSLTLPAPEAGDAVELILLYVKYWLDALFRVQIGALMGELLGL
jgi:hypothetical protein